MSLYTGVTLNFDKPSYFVYEHIGVLSVCLEITQTNPGNTSIHSNVKIILETMDFTASEF